MQRLVNTVRAVVTTALRYADTAVWMTTTPAAAHRGCCHDTRFKYSGAEHLRGQIASIGYCTDDAVSQNRLVAAMLRATFPLERVAIADTYAAVASRCGASYRDCAIQPQTTAAGQLYGCNVHFEKSSFVEVHAPAVASALSGLLFSKQT